ncbi:MAG: universal stress protein [Halobacteriales archaeon]
MYETILIAFDGSEPSRRALEHAFLEASGHDATLHAVYVVDTHRYAEPALSASELRTDAIEEWAKSELEAIEAEGADRGVAVETACRHGTPHQTIVAYADDIDADLVVLGYQGHGHRRHGRMGSVTDRVIQQLTRPALVV